MGLTPFSCAASNGHVEIVRSLLDVGAELDVSKPERNPLFGAIYGGHLEIVKLLVERGIDYRVSYTGQSMKNMDALAFALERGQREIARYLAVETAGKGRTVETTVNRAAASGIGGESFSK